MPKTSPGSAMNSLTHPTLLHFPIPTNVLRMLLILGLMGGTAEFVCAQSPSGTVNGSSGGPFTYSLTFSDAANATAPIGSIWYSWVPGLFFLPSTPTSATAPAGWTASIFANSIQFAANSPANDILPGQTLSGFGYDANFSPAQLEAAPNSGESVAYSGVFGPDAGQTFDVQTVPEPSTVVLYLLGFVQLAFMARARLRAT